MKSQPSLKIALGLLGILILGAGVVWLTRSPSQSSPLLETPPTTVVSSSASPTPVPQTSPAPAMQSSSNSAQAFEELAREALQTLPRKSSLRGLPAEAYHEVPAPIREAGKILGKIAEALANNPSLKPEAVRFYVDCASQSDGLTPVRALCAANLHRLDPKNPGWDRIPDTVRDLAHQTDDIQNTP